MAKRNSGDDIEQLKKVYQEHGWPPMNGKPYHKEECLKKTEEVWEKLQA